MNRRDFFRTTTCAAAEALIPSSGTSIENAGSALPQTDASDAVLYVATDGDDRNPGTQQRPLATLDRARDAVRELKKRTHGPITIWVRKGTYYLSRSLTFEPEDSGSSGQHITYAAYEGELATLSGGRRLKCHWKPYRDSIMKCELPAVKAGQLKFTQLFVNGKRQIRARFPNYDPKNPLVWGGGYIPVGRDEEGWPPTEFHFSSETFTKRRWAKPDEAVVHLFPLDYWGSLQWRVKDIDWDEHCIKLGWGGFQINELVFGKAATGIGLSQLYNGGFGSRFFIENVFEELDAPGEWYLDQGAGLLYYMPEEGVDLKSASVEVPVLDQVVQIKGSQLQPVHHIVISGFRIAHTASTFLNQYEAPSLGDWTIHRGGAVLLDGAEDCSVEKCFFDAVGGNAVFINGYNRLNRVYGNKITEAGDSAVCLVGLERLIQGTNHPVPTDNLISNNLIHDCGIFGKQVAGVFVSVAEKNIISHNVIYNLPRAGICINDGWGAGHIIEFNEIYDTVRETTDHGPFNSWGRGRFWCFQQNHGNVSHGSGYHEHEADYVFYYPEEDGHINIVRNNYFHEDPSKSMHGIDLDDGSSHDHIYNNLCIGLGITQSCGDYRTVENNIFLHPSQPLVFWGNYEYNHNRFTRNIVVTSTKTANTTGDFYKVSDHSQQGPIAEEIDYNLFFGDSGQFFASYSRGEESKSRYSLEEWRALGYDRHSIYADPLFVDPKARDYALKPDSPALKLGFKSFELGGVGLLSDFPNRWREKKDR
jgi:hypothetical protein